MLPLWASARPLSFPFPPALALRPSAAADPLHFLAFCILFFLLFSPLPSCCSISVTRILWPLTLLTRQMHPPFPLCHHCFLARQDTSAQPHPPVTCPSKPWGGRMPASARFNQSGCPGRDQDESGALPPFSQQAACRKCVVLWGAPVSTKCVGYWTGAGLWSIPASCCFGFIFWEQEAVEDVL